MDPLVQKALQRWPDVPACTGWLALDARGQWWIRDAEVHPWPRQGDGRLDKVGASRIQHEKLVEFIQRNYAADPQGYWFFQNGPQRVYVDLEAAPLILRLHGMEDGGLQPSWSAQTGQVCVTTAGYVDENGRLFFATTAGPAIMHSLDTGLLAPWLDDALQTLALPGCEALRLERVHFGDLQRVLGFRTRPSIDLYAGREPPVGTA